MIATWPPTLPPPQRDTWQLQPQDARRKRQSDSGPPGYRRRFSSVAKIITMTLILTRNQKATFDRFFHETCREGTVNFWMPDPTSNNWQITRADGTPLLIDEESEQQLLIAERWLCAWGDEVPTETMVQQVKFQKSFQLVVLP